MNNTIYGTRYTKLPETGDVPLVADISSCILSEPIDVSRFGLLYAGAQKNMAPAGLTVVIIREDLIGHAMDITPTMFNYKTHADNGSMYNTPPCYNIYIASLVLEWIRDEIGGLEEMKKINEKKAGMLYDFLDSVEAVPRHRCAEGPLADERAVRDRQRRAGREICQGGNGGRFCEPEGPPHRGRHARFHLQRHAGGRRGEAGRLHESVRGANV